MEFSNFVCCICRNIPDSVVESACCHSLFCWGCVVKCANTPCTACGKDLEPDKCTENGAIQKLIEKIPTTCRFVGCETLVTASTSKAHAAICEYATILCPNSELCGIFLRRDLIKHQKESCMYRRVRCHSCDTPLSLDLLQSHLEQDCSGVIVQCSNNCSSKGIQRSQLAKHLSKHCPYTTVACSFSPYGCDHIIMRSQVESHMQENVSKHLLMTTSLLEAQQREIATLREQVQNIQATPLLNVEQFREYLAGYIQIYRPILENIRASVQIRSKLATFFWLILLWLGMKSVHVVIRLAVLGYFVAKGYSRFVVPYRASLAWNGHFPLRVVHAICFAVCLIVTVIVIKI